MKRTAMILILLAVPGLIGAVWRPADLAECADGEVPKYDFAAVHYRASLPDAMREFKARGFDGIRNMTRLVDDVDCNTARSDARDAYVQCKVGGYNWEGAWDFSAGRCSVYAFDGLWSGSIEK